MGRQRYYFSDRLQRKRRNTKVCLAIFLIFAVSAGSAWSRPEGAVTTNTASFSLLSAADQHLSLLRSIHQALPQNVTDKDQRPAGNTAAPRLFAARNALGPTETPQPAPLSLPTSTLADSGPPPGGTDGRCALAADDSDLCRKRDALTVQEQKL
ncbi:MAG: hypothetical protein WBK55_06895 [Alphaproteobacteria bacterium]